MQRFELRSRIGFLIGLLMAVAVQNVAASQTIEWDPSFALSAEEAIDGLNQKKVVLVDVRPKTEFERVWIPGSLNIPSHFLKTKTYLKGRHLVLVDTGHAWLPLEAVCKELKQVGFRTSILSGGILAWQSAGGVLSGDAASLMSSREISPLVFDREKDIEGRIVVFVTHRESISPAAIDMDCLRLPLLGGPDTSLSSLKEEIAKQKNTALPVIVLNEEGERYGQVAALLKRAGVENTLFLTDGLMAYEKYQADRLRASLPREQRIRSVEKCSNCGPEANSHTELSE